MSLLLSTADTCSFGTINMEAMFLFSLTVKNNYLHHFNNRAWTSFNTLVTIL